MNLESLQFDGEDDPLKIRWPVSEESLSSMNPDEIAAILEQALSDKHRRFEDVMEVINKTEETRRGQWQRHFFGFSEAALWVTILTKAHAMAKVLEEQR